MSTQLIETQKYVRKPLYVDAVQVTSENFETIAAWCMGNISSEPNGTKYIYVRVHNPKTPRQSRAYVGDWILYTTLGYKVYTEKAFINNFDLCESENEEPTVT